MVEKPELIAFGQNSLGGVLSFYENLLNSPAAGSFDKQLILLQPSNRVYPKAEPGLKDTAVQVFSYSDKTMIEEVAAQLANIISNKPGVVIASFLVELASLHLHRKSQKTIYYICHDELYLDTAKSYEFLIDVYIAHNPHIYQQLCALMPKRKQSIFFIPYGIEIPLNLTRKAKDETLNLVFLARHVQSKGVFDIPKLTRILQSEGVPYHWTIFGDGEMTEEFRKSMNGFDNVQFRKYSSRQELYEVLESQHLFILPSSLDGVPVAMLESMSAGVVPIMYEFNPGIKDLLNESAAVLVPVGDYEAVAKHIAAFHSNRAMLAEFSRNAALLVKDKFDYNKQTAAYFSLFERYEQLKKPVRLVIKRYSGWLSSRIIPSWAVRYLRKLKSSL